MAAHYNNWGLANFHMKQYDQALEDFNTAIAIDTNQVSSLNPNMDR